MVEIAALEPWAPRAPLDQLDPMAVPQVPLDQLDLMVPLDQLDLMVLKVRVS